MRFRWVSAACCGGLAAAAGRETVSLAKAKDTPDYLIPHYLTTLRKRYNRYATVDELGRRRMTPDDFMRSVSCARKRNKEVPENASAEIGALFNSVNTDGSGVIKFGQFALFMTFLTTSRARFELAFRMFDSSETGTIGVEEFKEIVNALCRDESARGKIQFKAGVSELFFGPNLDRRLGFEDFWRFVSDLRTSVWRAEFRQFDSEGTGTITPAQFAQLACGPMVGSHLPFYLVRNIRKLEQKRRMTVTVSAWEGFNTLMLDADRLSTCIQTFTASGLQVDKSDFARAVKYVQPKDPSGVPKQLSPQMLADIDLIFALFDRDGDGHLEYDEFLSFARARTTMNVGGGSRVELPIGQLVLMCVQEAYEHHVHASLVRLDFG